MLLGKVDLVADAVAAIGFTALTSISVIIPAGGARVQVSASYGLSTTIGLAPMVTLVIDGTTRDQLPPITLALGASLSMSLNATTFLPAGSRTISIQWAGVGLRCRAASAASTERASISVLQVGTT